MLQYSNNQFIKLLKGGFSMHYITRSQYIHKKVEEFLSSSAPYFTIDLYSSEIRKITRDYSSLVIEKGPRTLASSDDKRFACVVRKK